MISKGQRDLSRAGCFPYVASVLISERMASEIESSKGSIIKLIVCTYMYTLTRDKHPLVGFAKTNEESYSFGKFWSSNFCESFWSCYGVLCFFRSSSLIGDFFSFDQPKLYPNTANLGKGNQSIFLKQEARDYQHTYLKCVGYLHVMGTCVDKDASKVPFED